MQKSPRTAPPFERYNGEERPEDDQAGDPPPTSCFAPPARHKSPEGKGQHNTAHRPTLAKSTPEGPLMKAQLCETVLVLPRTPSPPASNSEARVVSRGPLVRAVETSPKKKEKHTENKSRSGPWVSEFHDVGYWSYRGSSPPPLSPRELSPREGAPGPGTWLERPLFASPRKLEPERRVGSLLCWAVDGLCTIPGVP